MIETPDQHGVRCMLMRGGTSKGAFFVAEDLPANPAERDELILRLMGSPDPRQIDGLGGAHPLTTKVAVVGASTEPGIQVDYLFLQPSVDERLVADVQNCGNMLAGVGPFAVERGLVTTESDDASVRIRMVNTNSVAVATFPVESGRPRYSGDLAVSGVPGTSAPIRLDFEDVAGSSAGALFPTGNSVDTIQGVRCTLVDNGMPVVVIAADDLGVSGNEDCATLEANTTLRARLEQIRLKAGQLMNLGDVSDTTVPKLTLVSPPSDGGSLRTRTFIPHRCHEAIGVLGAVSVAVAAMTPGSPANDRLGPVHGPVIALEHPTGVFEAAVTVHINGGSISVERAGIIRTARKLMDGTAFPREYP